MAVRGNRVGVLTFHKCVNYGSYWQARCLVEGLRARGFDAELLDHDCACVRKAEARCALQPKLPERTARHELGQYKLKTRKFAQAIRALPQSQRFSLHQPQAAARYDSIVVGSDEVWNFRHPWYRGEPIFFGEGLKADRLVSYAASFGNYSCHWGMDERWAQQLKRFDRLSVRDQNSFWLVRGSTGVEPTIVLDPCLQFPEVAISEHQGSEAYALVYGYDFPEWLKTMVRRWANTSGVRLVSVGYTNDWADEQRVDTAPEDFPKLVGGARAVVTNFFHGCVFALLHGKPWAAVLSEYRSIKIPELASQLGAQHRLIDEATTDRDLAELLGTPVLPEVEARIDECRGHSQAYLDASLR